MAFNGGIFDAAGGFSNDETSWLVYYLRSSAELHYMYSVVGGNPICPMIDYLTSKIALSRTMQCLCKRKRCSKKSLHKYSSSNFFLEAPGFRE